MIIRINIIFFAKARELAGTSCLPLDTDQNTTYQNLLELVVTSFNLQSIRQNIILAINEEYQEPNAKLHLQEGDEVAVIPPLSGG